MSPISRALVVVVAAAHLGGCAYQEMLHHRTVSEVNKNTNDGFKEQSQQSAAVAPPEKMADLQKAIDEQNARMAAAEKAASERVAQDLKNLEAKFAFVEGLASVVGGSVGGPGGAALGSRLVQGFLKIDATEARALANGEAVEKNGREVGKLSEEVRVTATKTEEVRGALEASRRELAAVVAQNEKFKEKFDALDESLKTKLAGIRGTMDEQIAAAVRTSAGDMAKLRQEIEGLLAKAGLTNAQIQQLGGLSTEELIALLVTGGTAAGAGGLLSKLGRSRAKPEIDRLDQKAEDVRSRVEDIAARMAGAEGMSRVTAAPITKPQEQPVGKA